MNTADVRRILAQTVIVAAVAVGLWELGLRPMAARAARAEATLRADEAEVVMDRATGAVNDPEARIASIRARSGRLEELSREGGDAGSLYDLVGELAGQTQVSVQRIDPKGVIAPARDPEGRTERAVGGTSYTIEIVGPFDRIVMFLNRLERRASLERVTSLRIVPARSGQLEKDPAALTATIEVARYHLLSESASKTQLRGARGDN